MRKTRVKIWPLTARAAGAGEEAALQLEERAPALPSLLSLNSKFFSDRCRQCPGGRKKSTKTFFSPLTPSLNFTFDAAVSARLHFGKATVSRDVAD